MWLSFTDLLCRSFNAMTRETATSVLGFVLLTLGLTAVGWAAPIFARRRRLKQKQHLQPLRQALRESLWPTIYLVVGVVLLMLLVYLGFVACTVLNDEQSLGSTKNELELRRHNLIRGDPVVYDVRAMLAAFIHFRRAIGNEAECEIRLTVPRDFSGQLPSTLSMLANTATGCATNTLSTEDPDPEIEKQRKSGMRPETVVVHIRKDQKGGMDLIGALGSLMRLEASYELPPNSQTNLVWFQFGVGAKWNSERR